MYRLGKVLPQSGRQDVKISASGGQESIFTIPAKQVLNLNRSMLTFSYTIPPTEETDSCIRAYMNCMPFIRQIQLYTMTGQRLCDLEYANNYTRVVWGPETDLKDFLSYPNQTFAGLTESSNPIRIGDGFLFQRSNALINAAAAIRPTQGTDGSNLNYTEPQYVMQSNEDKGGGESQMSVNIRLPLGMYKNTIFSLDKDLYFGQTLTMRIVWEGSNRIYYYNQGDNFATDPDTGANVGNQPVQIERLSLYLAIQTNPSVVNSVVSQVQTGMSLILPFVKSYLHPLGGSSQNVQIKFTRDDGKRLCKIYHTVFDSITVSNTAYDINNIGDTTDGIAEKVYEYYTLLNRLRQQDFNLRTQELDDWKIHADYVKGSVIQTPNIYEYNWFHCDNYTGLPAIESHKIAHGEAGISLDQDQIWDFYGYDMENGPFNHNTFAVLQKILTLTEQGLSIS